jgi:hypothetical protein
MHEMTRVDRDGAVTGRMAIRALTLASCLFLPAPATADSWQWSLTPYAWLIGTEFSTTVDIPEDGEQDFEDIGDNLDFAAQLHLEAQRGRLGMLLDLTSLQLSDRTEQGSYAVKTDSTTTLVEAAVLLTAVQSNRGETALILGVRALDVDFDLDILPREEGAPQGAAQYGGTLTDIMLGARYRHELNDQWSFLLRGDVASGDTDFSWNTSIVVARSLGPGGQFLLGYRHLNVEFKRADELLNPTLTVSGPMLGYSFRF